MSDFEEISSKFEAVKIGMRHSKEGHILQLALHPDDSPTDILRDLLGTRYMIVAVRMNDEGEPVAGKDTEEGLKAIRLAGALCNDPEFQMWLAHIEEADQVSEEAAAIAMRRIIGVKSRSELKVDQTARKRLLALRSEFADYIRNRG